MSLSARQWPVLMDARTSAAYLGLSPRALRRLLGREGLDPIVLGPRTRRWRRSDLDLLAERLGAASFAPRAAAGEAALEAVARRQGAGRPDTSGEP